MWLVSLPYGEKRDATQSLNVIKDHVAGANAQIHAFQIPQLTVGTLDSLMSLSDDLVKTNTQIENVVRKVERQYNEIGSGKSSLKVGKKSQSVEAYLSKYEWDQSRYQYQGRQLPELVTQMQSEAAKVDEELKKYSTMYTEKVQALTALQRRRTINLATSDFEDFLTPERVARLEIYDTDTLKTLFVTVPKALEQEFLRTYSTIGADIALLGDCNGKYGNPSSSGRDREKGSPVVEGEAKKIFEEGDNILYSIVVLKGHYQAGYFDEEQNFVAGATTEYIEPIKHAFREKRFIAREWSYDSSRSGGLESQIADAQKQVQQVHDNIVGWCEVNFAEVFSAWIHLKMIRLFVESVLRYGVPPTLVTFFVEPNMKKEKQIKTHLSRAIAQLRPELTIKKLLEGEEEEDDDDNLPFVFQKFSLVGGSH